MIQSIYPDDPFRRHRNYLNWIGQRVCARRLNRKILEMFVLEAINMFIEHKPKSSKELSRSDLYLLDEFLCKVMQKEISSKKLLEIIAMRNRDAASEFAAAKCFSLFYDRHYKLLEKSVYLSCKRYGINLDEIKDITQQVFSLVWAKTAVFKDKREDLEDVEALKNSPQNWLSTIAKNLVLRIYDTKGIEIGIESLSSGTDDDPNTPSWEPILTPAEVNRKKEEAEKSAFGVPDPPIELDWEEDNELCKKLARKLLSGRELIIYLASIEHYADDPQKNQWMKKLDLELGIEKPNTRYQSISRSRKKIRKYVKDAAQKVLSGIELFVFLSVIQQFEKEKVEKEAIEQVKDVARKLLSSIELAFFFSVIQNYENDKNKGKAEKEAIEQKEKRERILKELKEKYGMTADKINKIFQDGRRKVKNYLEPVLQN